jgi:hypothetical protein
LAVQSFFWSKREALPHTTKRIIIARVAALGWLIAVSVLSLVDYKAFLNADQVRAVGDGFYPHAVAYFTGALVFWAAVSPKGPLAALILFAGLFAFSAMLEAAHHFLPLRVFNPNDLGGNFLGIAAFSLCLLAARIFRKGSILRNGPLR